MYYNIYYDNVKYTPHASEHSATLRYALLEQIPFKLYGEKKVGLNFLCYIKL
jgi:hypothetical protein